MLNTPDKCPYCNSAKVSVESADGNVKSEYECGTDVSRSGNVTVNNINCQRRTINEEDTTHLWRALQRSEAASAKHCETVPWFFDFVDAVAGLYERLQPALQVSDQPLHCSRIIPIQSIIIGRHELVFGALSLLRGRVEESASNLRRALEFTLFAAWAVEHEDAGEKWLVAAYPDRWEEYRSAFRIMRILDKSKWKKLQPIVESVGRLIQDYEEASTLVHATIFSARPQVEVNENIVSLTLRDHYQCELPNEILENYAITAINSHLNILDVLEKLTPYLGCQSPDGWRDKFKEIESNFNEQMPLVSAPSPAQQDH